MKKKMKGKMLNKTKKLKNKSTKNFVYMITDTNTGRFVIYDKKPNKAQLLKISISDLYFDENEAKDNIDIGEIFVDKTQIHSLKE